MNSSHLQTLIANVESSFSQEELIKLTLSNKREKNNELKTVLIKKVVLKAGERLSFTYRYNTKDITKNHDIEVAITEIQQLLSDVFFQADLFTTAKSYHFAYFKNGKSSLKQKQNKNDKASPNNNHNRDKKRMIKTEENVYLRALGVTTSTWKVKNDMQDKYRQINKYVEIIDTILKSSGFESEYTIVDMGAGKGYLTLSLYDYLSNVLNQTPKVIGVEMRKDLVEKSNAIADEANFDGLSFMQGTIQDVDIPSADVLIALHACDTATDDAIYRGIKSDSKVIISAPCCHKQVRKQIDPKDDLEAITQYGILKERQSELLTDAIRALVLEAYGYKTKVFEFIATEHTPKNILIVGVKSDRKTKSRKEIFDKIDSIKKIHGLDFQYLEHKLRSEEPEKTNG